MRRPAPSRAPCAALAVSAALALALALASVAGLPAAPAAASQDVTTRLFGMVDRYMTLREEWKAASPSTWVPFRDPPKSRARGRMDAYLDRVLEVLLEDDVSEAKKAISGLERKNAGLQEKAARLELEKAAAPEDTRFYEVWKSSRDAVDRRIAGIKEEMEANRALMAERRGEIRLRLAREGIELSEDELRNLLMTVSGDDQLDGMVALKNIYQISGRLRELMRTSGSLAVSRKYYGVFLIAVQAHELQLVSFRERVKDEYLPRLEAIREENRALMGRTRKLAEGDGRYRANVTAQEMTERVGARYRELLVNQDKLLEQRLAALRRVIAYVENTYETVSLASGLADSMEDSLTNLQALLEMPVVPPVAFESSLEEKFQELSARISAGPKA